MNRIALLLYLAFITLGAKAQSDKKINWMSFEEAIEASKTTDKKFFIDVYTNWCGWCKKMDRTTFTNPVIADLLNKYYFPVKLDAEMTDSITVNGKVFVNENPNKRRSPHQLAIALLNGKMSYPSTVYLDEKGNMLHPIPGYQDPKSLEPILTFFAKDEHLKENANWEKYQQNFKSKLEK